MSGISRSTVFHALLSGTTGPVTAGQALLYNTAGTRLIVATDANRTATGRVTAGICLTDADNTDVRVEVQFAGPLPPSVSGLSTGTATTVYVDSNGDLARGDGSEDDVVGECDTDGTVYLLCGGLYSSGGGGVATPGGSDTQVQYNDSSALGGDAGLTYNDTTNVLSVTGAVNVGSDPAALTGGVNLSYGLYNGINSNNSNDTDQVNLIALRDGTGVGLGTNLIQIGAGYNLYFAVGTGRTWTVRCDNYVFEDGNGSEIAGWETYGLQLGATTSDFGLGQGVLGLKDAALVPSTNPTAGIIIYSESGVLKYRQPDGTVVTPGGGGATPGGSDTQVQYNDGGALGADSGLTYDGAGGLTTSAFVQTAQVQRDATHVIADHDASNLYLGCDTSSSNAFANIRSYAGSAFVLGIAGVNHLEVISDEVLFKPNNNPVIRAATAQIRTAAPLAGSSTDSMPFRLKRVAITISGNTTLTAAQYECVFIDLGGAPGAGFEVVCPNVEGATFNIRNATGQTATIKRSGGSGVALASGLVNWFVHNGTDYEARVDT
jgi:hypothetical protein